MLKMLEEYKIPLVKDTTRVKPVFVLQGRFYYVANGLASTDLRVKDPNGDKSLEYLGFQIEEEIGEYLKLRAVRGNRLEQILTTGHDIPGMKKGDVTFATERFDKVKEYIVDSARQTVAFSGGELLNDATILLYANRSLQILDAYEVRFMTEPIEALRAVLLLKAEVDVVK